ncbi:MAG: cell division ATP-binding protein FtsE [Alphaproteobacteria bacterium]
MIRFDNVGMRYGMGDEVLKDVSFELKPGSFHFLTGRSGAGKTSLLRLMYLAVRPSRGLIKILGEDVVTAPRKTLPRLRREIGVVFQDYRLLDHMTAFDNVALPLRLNDTPKDKVEEHVTELLSWVGLKDRMQARPPTLSGGEKQRVAIARAVINRPRLLLADEPTGNLDDDLSRRLLHLFAELNKVGTTVIVATHDLRLVDAIDAPRLHLDQGTLTVPDTTTPPETFSKDETTLPEAAMLESMQGLPA